MTTKRRFASGGLGLLTLLGALLATPAQSDGLAIDHQGISTILNATPGITPAAMVTASSSPAETTLRNLDTSLDTLLPFRPSYLHLEQAVLVGALESVMPYEQRIRDAIDKSYVISAAGEHITLASENAIDVLGRLIEQADLPLHLDQAAGALVRNTGDAIGSVGGMLYDDPSKPYPLTSALSHTTGGLAAATTALFQANHSLQPLNGATGTPATPTLPGSVDNLMVGLTDDGSSVASSNHTPVLEPISALLKGLLGGPPR